jgi:hypothetical protein
MYVYIYTSPDDVGQIYIPRRTVWDGWHFRPSHPPHTDIYSPALCALDNMASRTRIGTPRHAPAYPRLPSCPWPPTKADPRTGEPLSRDLDSLAPGRAASAPANPQRLGRRGPFGAARRACIARDRPESFRPPPPRAHPPRTRKSRPPTGVLPAASTTQAPSGPGGAGRPPAARDPTASHGEAWARGAPGDTAVPPRSPCPLRAVTPASPVPTAHRTSPPESGHLPSPVRRARFASLHTLRPRLGGFKWSKCESGQKIFRIGPSVWGWSVSVFFPIQSGPPC